MLQPRQDQRSSGVHAPQHKAVCSLTFTRPAASEMSVSFGMKVVTICSVSRCRPAQAGAMGSPRVHCRACHAVAFCPQFTERQGAVVVSTACRGIIEHPSQQVRMPAVMRSTLSPVSRGRTWLPSAAAMASAVKQSTCMNAEC